MPEPSSPPAPFQFLELTRFEVAPSAGFAGWLADQGVSLVFTNADRVFLVGLKPDGALAVAAVEFPLATGIAAVGAQTLYLATEFQLWRLENGLPPGHITDSGHDALFIPQSAYTTGVLGIHDVAVDADGQPIFANTLFSCLATVSERYNFVPLWRPPFLPRLAATDSCHLTGLALRDGRPAYVTSASQDSAEHGWREHKRDGGTVTDVAANRVILTGLSMPYSPRLYRDQLWLTNAGHGELGRVDLQRGRYEPVVFAPGFLRGLDFVGQYAVVASSKAGNAELYAGLPLEETLRRQRLKEFQGLYIVDLDRGEIVHSLALHAPARELYSVAVLPGVRRPFALEPNGEPIQEMVTVGPLAVRS